MDGIEKRWLDLDVPTVFRKKNQFYHYNYIQSTLTIELNHFGWYFEPHEIECMRL